LENEEALEEDEVLDQKEKMKNAKIKREEEELEIVENPDENYFTSI